MVDHQELLNQVISIVREVGTYQSSFFRAEGGPRGYTKSPREIVSRVDIESEHKLKSRLLALIENAGFFGEETDKDLGEEYSWVVDPIDGTINYLCGIRQWCISVALLYRREPVVATIYEPESGDLFTAIAGRGAFLNERRLPLTPFEQPLSQAVLATGMPFRSEDIAAGFFTAAARLLPKCREIRRLGSAALDMAYLAAGFFQGYWEADLALYDMAAGLLLLKEAGVCCTDYFGNPFDPFTDRSLAAFMPSIGEEFIPLLAEAYDPYREVLGSNTLCKEIP